jgi:8-amino-7-oxononanoate synthase/6-carboxyhexanoate--CoA ligase
MLKELKLLLNSKVTKEKNKFDNINSFVGYLKDEDLFPRYEIFGTAGTEPKVKTDTNELLMFSSNNYLGLAKHPKVIAGIKEQAEEHGGGPGGSRFLCGNIDILNNLDTVVAKTIGKEDAITFPTGYMANLAIFTAVMDPFMAGMPYAKGSGVIFSDENNHATIVDGCRLSSAKKVIFKHNDVEDLENKLKKYALSAHKLIVTEGVFSLDGHLGKLKEISKLAKKYNCILMVDDAHGVGVLGESGGGAPEVLGVTKDIDILMGSFDKTIGCMGGYLAGDKKIIEYLRVAARPYMFSSAVPAAMAGGAIESLKICSGDEGKALRDKLMNNSNYLKKGLSEKGFRILGDGSISVLPVVIGHEDIAIKFSNRLLEEGVFIPCFRWPAVPKGEARARVTLMATHKKEELDKLLAIFEKVGKELNII